MAMPLIEHRHIVSVAEFRMSLMEFAISALKDEDLRIEKSRILDSIHMAIVVSELHGHLGPSVAREFAMKDYHAIRARGRKKGFNEIIWMGHIDCPVDMAAVIFVTIAAVDDHKRIEKQAEVASKYFSASIGTDPMYASAERRDR
jgi:hypothetical protein